MARYYYVREVPHGWEKKLRADSAVTQEVAYMGRDGATGTTQLTLFLEGKPVAQFVGDALSWFPVEEDDT